MALNLITIPLPDFRPVSNITPFTIRDGATFLGKFEELRHYVTHILVPAIDAENKEIETSWEGQITFLTDYINQAIDAIINDSVDIQDPVVAQLIGDLESATRMAMNGLFADKDIEEVVLTGRLSQTALDSAYAAKSVETIVTSGRLTQANLDGAYAAKTVQDLVSTGRLTEANLNAAYADKAIETLINSGRLSTASLDSAYAQQSVEDVVNTGRLSAASIASLFGPIIRGDNGKKYQVLGTALRNTGTGWASIIDDGHRPTGIDGISQTATQVVIDHTSINATKVVAFYAVPDEGFAGILDFGCSVGLTQTRIYISRREQMSDYISYNGTAWTSLTDDFAPGTFNAGILTITNNNVFNAWDGGDGRTIAITGRDGASAAYRYSIASSGFTFDSIDVAIRDNAGALITTPNANMRFSVTRGGFRKALDPADVNTGNYPGSNIWVFGLFEVA